VIREHFYRSYLKSHCSEIGIADLDRLIPLNNENRPSPELRIIFGQIRQSMDAGVDSELYYEIKITEMLYLIATGDIAARNAPKRNRSLSKEDFTAVSRVKNAIDERFSEPLKIAELAFRTGTSAAKLQNDFKAAFGCTIHKYLQRTRMTAAMRKIEDGEAPLYVVAREVGFKKPGRFTELFKRTYGIAPNEYRRAGRDGKDVPDG
jgi:AraC-like DNA-binding protein